MARQTRRLSRLTARLTARLTQVLLRAHNGLKASDPRLAGKRLRRVGLQVLDLKQRQRQRSVAILAASQEAKARADSAHSFLHKHFY